MMLRRAEAARTAAHRAATIALIARINDGCTRCLLMGREALGAAPTPARRRAPSRRRASAAAAAGGGARAARTGGGGRRCGVGGGARPCRLGAAAFSAYESFLRHRDVRPLSGSLRRALAAHLVTLRERVAPSLSALPAASRALRCVRFGKNDRCARGLAWRGLPSQTSTSSTSHKPSLAASRGAGPSHRARIIDHLVIVTPSPRLSSHGLPLSLRRLHFTAVGSTRSIDRRKNWRGKLAVRRWWRAASSFDKNKWTTQVEPLRGWRGRVSLTAGARGARRFRRHLHTEVPRR